MRKKLMEVAEECRPKEIPWSPTLTRDETLKRIGELTERIIWHKAQARELATRIEPLMARMSDHNEVVRQLQEDKLMFEASIHKVTKVDIRAVRKRKAKPKTELDKLKEQIHNKILNMTPKEIENLKKKGLL